MVAKATRGLIDWEKSTRGRRTEPDEYFRAEARTKLDPRKARDTFREMLKLPK